MKTLSIGYSTCPNDTFIFAGLAIHDKDALLAFDPVLADIETLNRWALEGRVDISKLSFFAFGKVREQYALLHSGGALGRGCGPILVARRENDLEQLRDGTGKYTIAAPGNLTTARLLLTLFLGYEPQFRQMVFSNVMPAVRDGEADFGLVIHEGRFTLDAYGLQSALDLGQWWEEETGFPIPLGGIAVRRNLGSSVARQVDQRIQKSLLLAESEFSMVNDYVKAHAQEMASTVIQQHIDLYVNRFTRELGDEGEKAVRVLLQRAESAGLLTPCDLPLLAY
ncbi:MAG: 1,4-dihydroxy-6-naphthoate synthase [Deltaproteobacteria bacterium]|nr:1,4-dihydroxy-6-naphthoate synthase [Deltaproteobacteria bacterium]